MRSTERCIRSIPRNERLRGEVMFRKVLWMDLKRGFFSRRFVLVLVMNTLLLFASAADEFIRVQNVYTWQEKQIDFGAVDWHRH